MISFGSGSEPSWFLAFGTGMTVMATSGMLLGLFLDAKIGKWAEILGGVVLIGIGCSIPVEHLGLLD